jgi:hypothetical protein
MLALDRRAKPPLLLPPLLPPLPPPLPPPPPPPLPPSPWAEGGGALFVAVPLDLHWLHGGFFASKW